MSFSYDPTDLGDELNRLRLEIGDTDSNDPFLDDQEIVQVQSEKSSFFLRAAKCCDLICAKLARDVKIKVGGFSEDAQKVYDRYREMSLKFSRSSSSSYPWAGSILVSDKEAIEDNTDLVKPKFKLGMHDA